MTNDRLEQADVDLRPYGWAPGGYSFRCRDCPPVASFQDWAVGAKRSWRCERHAEIAKVMAENVPAHPTEQADVQELVERLLAIDEGKMYDEPATTYAVCQQAATTITAQAAEIARLRDALQPFSDCCEELDGSEWTPRADDEEWAKFRLLVKHYRAARAALESKS